MFSCYQLGLFLILVASHYNYFGFEGGTLVLIVPVSVHCLRSISKFGYGLAENFEYGYHHSNIYSNIYFLKYSILPQT